MSEMEFKLSSPIKISVSGDFTEVDVLTLYAPPAKEKKLPIRLRKGFMKAAMGFAGKGDPEKSKDDDKDLNGADIESMLFASDIDVEKYMTDFRTLMLVEGVCTSGGKGFLQNHWDGMTAEDAMRLMGEYIAHFFTPSWLPKETTTR